MPRRIKGRPIHGWLVLDKPLQMTSTAAVGNVKRLFGAQKAGHAGTLDPLATGVLPIAFGEATKTVSFAMDGEKSYRFSVRWGSETTTDDGEGTVTRTSSSIPDEEAIHSALGAFRGLITQVPPLYSAIKVAGQRSYDLARDGEDFLLPARDVLIKQLDLLDINDAQTATFKAVCGKGTYIRALARDLGRSLGCYGHISSLRRTQVGPFRDDAAWSFQSLDNLRKEESPIGCSSSSLLPIEAALSGLPNIKLSSADASRLIRGQSIHIRGVQNARISGQGYASCDGRLVALIEGERGEVRPTRVFNLSAK
ncbi:MAG: tRNA pseudouridine(55) synthase TruB [Hyphomicrobiaceae bacterium]